MSRPTNYFLKPPSLPCFFLQTCILFTTLILLAFRHHASRLIPLKRKANFDHCFIVAGNHRVRDLWQFNTRSLCVSSNICLSKATLHRAPTPVKCTVTRPDFSPMNQSFPALLDFKYRSCAQLQHLGVHCAHGTGLRHDYPVCPDVVPLTPSLQKEIWIDNVSIVVPEFPWQRNIFHYAKVVTDLMSTLHNLPVLLRRREGWVRNVNVYFQGGAYAMKRRWQRELLQLAVRDMAKKDVNVSVHFMEGMDRVCLRNAVLLGRRGHVNSWPFMNGSEVPLDGMSVPKEAVAFKKAVYNSFGMKGGLPSKEKDIVSELPPFSVGYSRRDMKPNDEGYYRHGANRRFSREDEVWLEVMLKNETKSVGAKLFSFAFESTQSLREQVNMMAKVGFIIGIHGANLVNAIFMRPFGAMLEIFPKGATERCYVAGGNSGLKYLRFEASEMASPAESGCDPRDVECRQELRQRRIKLDKLEDRERIRRMVREGIRHLSALRGRFAHGIPVQLNKETVNYDVVEEKARSR